MGGGLFFILAVMGLSYIGIRSTLDDSAHKANAKKYKTEYEIDQERLKEWTDAVTDKALEIEFEDRLHNCDAELLQEVRDSWPTYFHDEEPPKRFDNSTLNEDSEFIGRDRIYLGTALRILLANRGKLRYHDAAYGIWFISSWNGCTRADEDREKQRYSTFFHALNRQLRLSKVQAPFYVNPQSFGYNGWEHWGRLYRGTVMWAPAIPKRGLLNSHLYDMSMKRL